jgi:membrane-associated PAP2 superfamily phosphatase
MSTAATLADLSPIQFVLAVALAALLATGVFAHASRHGSRHATAWGVATFLLAGIVVPVYFIRYLLRRGRG